MVTYFLVTILICAIIGVSILYGAVALWGLQSRKERERRSRNEGGHTPPPGGADAAPGIVRGRLSLQPLRRADPDAPKYIGGPVHRPAPTWAGPETGERGSNAATVVSPIYPEPQRPSAMILDAGVRGQISPIHPDSTHPDPRSVYHQSHNAGDRASLPSAITPESVHPVWTTPVSPSGHRHTLSSDTRTTVPSMTYPDSIYPVSTLPSYPGTVRSVSPPAYSDLSRTRSGQTLRGSSRGVSFYNESAVEPMPNITHLEEVRGRV